MTYHMAQFPKSGETPSAWVCRFVPMIRSGGNVLDLACGIGGHARWLAAQGWQVEAVDRDAVLLEGLQNIPGISARCADLEQGAWPYASQCFDGIVVTRYLHRPLLPLLAEALHENGVLIYETFMLGNEQFGRPRSPEFLLRPDELLEVFGARLSVIAFEQGVEKSPRTAVMQRICAVNAPASD